MEVLKSLFTIVVLVILGTISRKTNIFAREHIKTISSFVYYFALPSLFFVQLSQTDIFSFDYHVLIGSIVPIIIIIVILIVFKACRCISKDNFILYGLSVCFGGHAFFGIAFFETLYAGKWLSLAIVTSSMLGLTGIVLCIVLFEYASNKKQGFGFLLKILRNPLILSIFIGLLFSILKFRVEIILNALSLIGKSAGGLAIFSLGIFINDNISISSLKKALSYSTFRLIVLPLVTLLVIFVSLNSVNSGIKGFLFLQSGIPAAISLVVFAERYEYKIPEITGMVILTSLLSFIILLILFYISEIVF